MKRITALLATLFLLAACGSLDGDLLTFKTASPNLNVGVRLRPGPQVELPTVTPAPEVIVPSEEVGEVEPVPTLAPPCETIVKGNISKSQEKIAHSPGQANYEKVRIDESKGEKWFCNLADAEAEGWRAAKN